MSSSMFLRTSMSASMITTRCGAGKETSRLFRWRLRRAGRGTHVILHELEDSAVRKIATGGENSKGENKNAGQAGVAGGKNCQA